MRLLDADYILLPSTTLGADARWVARYYAISSRASYTPRAGLAAAVNGCFDGAYRLRGSAGVGIYIQVDDAGARRCALLFETPVRRPLLVSIAGVAYQRHASFCHRLARGGFCLADESYLTPSLCQFFAWLTRIFAFHAAAGDEAQLRFDFAGAYLPSCVYGMQF